MVLLVDRFKPKSFAELDIHADVNKKLEQLVYTHHGGGTLMSSVFPGMNCRTF